MAIKPSPVLEKRKGSGNDPHSKRIKVEEGDSDSKKVFKWERTKKYIEEINESENLDNNEKIEMGDLSSNLDGYFGSKGVLIGKDNMEGSKDRNTNSNVGSKALGEDNEK